IDVLETLALLQAEALQRDVPGVGSVAAIILPVDVEVMEVFITPREEDLEHAMEVRQGGVAGDHEARPDRWTDAAQDETRLIDHRGAFEFIPIKALAAMGSDAPGSCAGRSTVPSPDHGRLLSTGGCGLSRYGSV